MGGVCGSDAQRGVVAGAASADLVESGAHDGGGGGVAYRRWRGLVCLLARQRQLSVSRRVAAAARAVVA